jgi:TatA/E family protein of Tat protein translocase
MNLGAFEVVLIAIAALVLFGPQRLPEIARTIGKSLREFRRATNELSEEIRAGIDSGSGDTSNKPRDLRPGPRG